MKSRTPIVTLAITALFLSGALTACTGGGQPTVDGDVRGPSTEDCPEGVVTLSVLRAENNIPTDAQIERYQADNPCVEFEVDEVPFGQLAEKISVVASANVTPDVIGYDGPATQSYASLGLLRPMDEHLPEGWLDDVVPATLTEHSWNGNVYSLGLLQDAMALYYNKDLTDAAGIEPPVELEDAWTWEEAREAFEACQQGSGDNPAVWGLAPNRVENGAYRDLLFVRSMGDPDAPEDSTAYKTFWGISPDGSEAVGWLNTPEAVEGATFLQDLYNGDSPVRPKTGIPNALIDGKACFDIDSTFNIGFLTDAGVNWGVSPLPYFETPIAHTGALTLGVTNRSDSPNAASEFVVTLSTGDYLKEFSETSKRPPVLRSVLEEIPLFGELPYSLFVAEIQQWGQPRPPSPKFVQYAQVLTDTFRDISFGGIAPQDALDQAAEKIQTFLPPAS